MIEQDGTVYLFDKNQNLFSMIAADRLFTHSQTSELNGLITAEFSCPYKKDYEDAIFFGHRDIDDPDNFYMYRVTSSESTDGVLVVEGIHTFFDEMLAYGYMNEGYTWEQIDYVMHKLLLETLWEVGSVSNTDHHDIYWDYLSNLESFWDTLEVWGVEFRLRMTFVDGVVTGRYVDLADEFSEDNGAWYEYGDKLLTVTKVREHQEVVTALVGLGKTTQNDSNGEPDGRLNFTDVEWRKSWGDPLTKPLYQEYLEFPAATALYGYQDGGARFGVVEFEDVEDAEDLLWKTYEKLMELARPKENYKANFHETHSLKLGEVVTIVRDDLGIRYKTRVFKVTRNFLNPNIREFEMGDSITTEQWEVNKRFERKHRKTRDRCDWFEHKHGWDIADLDWRVSQAGW